MAALWTGKPADLLLYAVRVFENHPPTSSLPKQAVTDVSEQGLEWKTSVLGWFSRKCRFSCLKLGLCIWAQVNLNWDIVDLEDSFSQFY